MSCFDFLKYQNNLQFKNTNITLNIEHFFSTNITVEKKNYNIGVFHNINPKIFMIFFNVQVESSPPTNKINKK